MVEIVNGEHVGYDRKVVEESGCVVPLKILKTYGKRNTTYCLVEYFGHQYELPERSMCTREEAEELAIRTLVRKLHLLDIEHRYEKEASPMPDEETDNKYQFNCRTIETKLARFVKKRQ